MRYVKGLVVLLFIVAGTGIGTGRTAAAQESEKQTSTLFGEVRSAFETGDVDALLQRSSERLDVTLFGNGKLLSRSQAKYVLIDFFRQYPPVRLHLEETSGTEGNWLAAGSYWFENGEEPLSVYIRLRANDGEKELREIRVAGRIAR